MKIFYLSAYDQPFGQSSRTFDISRELVKCGHEVFFFTNSYCHFTHIDRISGFKLFAVEKHEGVVVVFLKTNHYAGNGIGRGINMLLNFLLTLFVSKFFIKIRPHIVIAPSVPLFSGFAGYCIGRRYKIPFVFEIRDIWPQALVDLGALRSDSVIYKVFRFVEKFLYSRAVKISSVLPLAGIHIAESGFPNKSVVWIPNGIDSSQPVLPFDAADDSHLFKVLYLGGFSHGHDVQSIIESAKMLQDRYPGKFSFHFYGDGEFKPKAEDYVALNQIKNVKFHNRIGKNKVHQVLSSGDVLVAALRDIAVYRYGINLNKICDYMQSARPIILSANVPNDSIKNAGCGVSVRAESPRDIADALVWLSKLSVAERMQMGLNGRVYFDENFRITKVAKKMEDLLISCLV